MIIHPLIIKTLFFVIKEQERYRLEITFLSFSLYFISIDQTFYFMKDKQNDLVGNFDRKTSMAKSFKFFESSINSFLYVISNKLMFIPYSDPILLLRQLKNVCTCFAILYLCFVKSLGLHITAARPIHFFFEKTSNIPSLSYFLR
jgi:hypothetical protein